MSKIMNDNFKINVGNPIDSRYLNASNQPYASVSAVNSAIVQSQRYVGLTVNVDNVEYWYCGGVADGNLVIKDSGIASTGITSAANGLSKVGSTVALGGTLTGDTTFTGSASALLQYGGNYRSGYDQYSIPDAGFVTGLTSQSVITASNGLTKTGQDVKLGGTTPLTENTSICGGGYNLCLGTAAQKVGAFQVNAGSAAILTTGATEICPTGTLFLDGSIICVQSVANYDTNYASSYTPRSLVDAAYVTGNTNLANYYTKTQINSYSAATDTRLDTIEADYVTGGTNGLSSADVHRLKLGGALTETTIIGTGSQTFGVNAGNVNITGSTVGIGGTIKVTTAPATGGVVDNILVRSSDGTIKQVAGTSLGAITGATNGLTKVGQNVVLGGALTGNTNLTGAYALGLCTTTVNVNPTGNVTLNAGGAVGICPTGAITLQGSAINANTVIAYNSSKAPYSALQLPNAAWVTGLTSQAILTATNGLTKTGTAVCLGGTLTSDMTINLNTGNCFRLCENGLPVNYIFNLTGVTLSNCSSSFKIGTAGANYRLTHCSGRYVDLNSSGLTYGGDYSTCFKPLTLVPKCYVDNATGSISANNGLSRKGSNIVLGGGLTGDTTISGASTLTISSDFVTCCQSYIRFEENSSHIPATPTEGMLYYSANSLNFVREFPDVVLQIGEETVMKVKNNTAGTILNGQAVYISGSDGAIPTITKAIASDIANAQNTIGLATHDIEATGEGFVTLHGAVRGLDTSTLTGAQGSPVYLSPTVAGTLTSTPPNLPNKRIHIGYLIVKSTNGQIEVAVDDETPYLDVATFTGYTATTNTTLNSKLACTVFNSYTGTTQTCINYLDCIADRAITGATNGLSCVATRRVCLGGTLSAPVTISGAQNFAICANNVCLQTRNTCDIALNAMTNGAIYIKSQEGTVESSNDYTNAVGILLDYNASPAMLVCDGRTTPRGLMYHCDYSDNFCDNSLITKYYVDSVATGLNVHGAVSLATTVGDGNITLSGLTGTIDGVAVSAITSTNNRILVKNQTSGGQNGIYSASTGIWGRTSDYDFSPAGEIANGDLVPVVSGFSNANSQWVLVTPNPIVSGETLTFSLFAQQQGIIEGNGICVTTAGANRQIDVKLSGSNPGLCFDGTALELDYNIFSSGLTETNGSISVNASTTPVVGTPITVHFGTGCALVVDSNDFSYSQANNGLTKTGNYIGLGGALTGDTSINGAGGVYDLSFLSLDALTLSFNSSNITDNSGGEGLVYSTDYKSTFVDNSLVSKLFVNNAITGNTLTYNNGITKAGKVISWGGNLTGDTSVIWGSGRLCLSDAASISCVDLIAQCTTIRATEGSAFVRSCINGSCEARLGVTCEGIMELVANNATQGLTITSAAHGAVYAGDYENNFVARSLATAQYVTGLTNNIDSRLDTIEADYVTGGTEGICKSDAHTLALGGTMATGAQIFMCNPSLFRIGGCSSLGPILNLGNCSAPQYDLTYIGYTNSTSPSCGSNMSFTKDACVVITSLSGSTGKCVCLDHAKALEYGADYSLDYTNRSLVDKEYVDTLVTGGTGISLATNGLTKVGNTVVLGGTLTGATTIATDDNQISILDTSGYGLDICEGTSALGDYNSTQLGYISAGQGYVFGYAESNTTNNSSWFSAGVSGAELNYNASGSTKSRLVSACDNQLTLLAYNNSGCQTQIAMLETQITVSGAQNGNASCFSGITYAQNYCPYFTNRSLVDKQYVDNAASGVAVTANNGLTKEGQNIRLGGGLTGSTAIDTNNLTFSILDDNTYGLCIANCAVVVGDPASSVAFMRVDGSTNCFTMCAGGTGVVTADNLCLRGDSNLILYTPTNLQISGDTMLITDISGNGYGLRYTADYSGTFLDSSLVTKCYVDNAAGAIAAGNGLTRDGNAIILGGTLTGTTTICGAQTLNLGDATAQLTALQVTTPHMCVSDDGGNSYIDFCHDAAAPFISMYVNDTNTGNVYGGIDLYPATTVPIMLYADNGDDYLEFRLSNLDANTNANYRMQSQNALYEYTQETRMNSTSNWFCEAIQDKSNAALNIKLVGNYANRSFVFSKDNSTVLSILSGGTARYGIATTASAITNDADLANKIYVDSVVSGITNCAITTANNGLTKVGQNVVLGGSLTGSTTITGGAHDFTVSATNVNLTGSVCVTGAMDTSSTLGVGGTLTLDSVAAGDAVTDSVMTITSGGVVRKVPASSLGEDNNVYAMTVVTTDVTLTTGSTYVQLINNASSGLTITLPANPINGQVFRIKDAAGAALNYPITIARNGKLIDGAANNGILNTDGGALELVYNNALGSWFVFSFVN